MGPTADFSWQSVANGVSETGSIAVGTFINEWPRPQAFRWDAAAGIVRLGETTNSSEGSWAFRTSADGSIVVGEFAEDLVNGRSYRAVYLDAAGEMHDLNVVLRAMGIDLTGWTLVSARDVSADGRTIVGFGLGPSGLEAWIAVIPEPGTALLIGVGLMALARARASSVRDSRADFWSPEATFDHTAERIGVAMVAYRVR
ncbi:MAG: hypothetical protein KJO44_07010 [Gemmatimonadetes bacterium]|nr:hypothetical protein [Gemmatimonadota bacterium]